MAIDAIGAKLNTPIEKINAKEQGKKDTQLEVLQQEVKQPVEMLIFAKTAKFNAEAPKIAAVSKPVLEQSQAAAGSAKPAPQLFTFNNEGRFVVASHSPSGSMPALASALSGAENNKGSGDKKDGQQNTFLSAHKSLKDTRYEALGDDNFISIMKGLC